MVHRRELVEQTSQTFAAMGIPHGLIVSGAAPCYELPVQIASVYTLAHRLGDGLHPDLLICDECHHSTAGTYKAILDQWPSMYVLGVTATPQRTDGTGLSDVFQSMVEGPTANDLIRMGNLSQEKAYTLPSSARIDRSKFRIRHGDYVMDDVAKAMDDANIFGDIIGHYQKLIPGKRAICYCITREYSAKLAERFRAAGIPSTHVDCKTPKKEREKAVSDFREGRVSVLCNVDLFGEGFDVPAMDAVILARPTASLILHIQQTMRCMRPDPAHPDKTAIILDHVGNIQKHGLPEMDRAWSLESKKRKQAAPPVKTCPQCYLTVAASVKACPACGYVWPQDDDEGDKRRKAVEDETVALVRVDPHAKFLRRMRVAGMLEKASTMQDLYNIAAYAGYKPGWAYYQAKARGIR